MTEREINPARQELHWLLDHIPATKVAEARTLLASLADPVALSLLNAPIDDEVETPEERAQVELARCEPGPGTPHEDLMREFGL